MTGTELTTSSPMIPDELIAEFLSRHRLPSGFREVAERHYVPLAARLPEIRGDGTQLLLGINGAQGTGKSTLADFLQLATETMFGWNVAVLSIDDFYLTQAERRRLSSDVHPLLMTRGVPGTHDTDMLSRYLTQLRHLAHDESIALPRFDKAIDDRADEAQWPVVSGPIDLVILEGWCVGTRAQSDIELEGPENALERDEDEDGRWRTYVNSQLRLNYEPIFGELDYLVFLRAPSFDAILRWRLEQEEKLARKSPEKSSGVMSREQVTRFIQFYERLTRANLTALPDVADVVIRLDETHSVQSCKLNQNGDTPDLAH